MEGKLTGITKAASRNCERLRPSRKLYYAAGELGMASLLNITTLYLLFFYTEVAGLAPAAAGAALMFGRLGNAVTEPLIGYYSDRTVSSLGRRRPYLIAAAFPGALFCFLLFNPPALLGWGLFAYLLVSNLMFCISISIFNVPYGALGAELTPNYDERTSVMSYRMIAAALGGLLGASLPVFLAAFFLETGAGYKAAAAVVAVLSFTAMTVTILGTGASKTNLIKGADIRLWGGIFTVFQNRSYLIFITALFALNLGMAVITLCLIYIVVYWLQAGSLMPALIVVLQLCSILSAPGWHWFSTRTSKKAALQLCLLLLGGALLGMYFLNPGISVAVFFLMALGGVGISGTFILPLSIIPDICDEDEVNTGQRREGAFFGAYGMVRNISGALGTLMVGLVLGLVGFEPGLEQQSPAALDGLRFLFSPVVAFLCLLSFLAIRWFPLTRDRHAALRAQLGAVVVHGRDQGKNVNREKPNA